MEKVTEEVMRILRIIEKSKTPHPDPFEILNINRTASIGEIKASYRYILFFCQHFLL